MEHDESRRVMKRVSQDLRSRWHRPSSEPSGRTERTLAGQLLDAVVSHSAGSCPSDRQLIEQIVGAGGTAEGYFFGGFVTAAGIRAYLASLGSTIHDFRRVLDFGCGSARVLRWFQDARPAVELYGCDINPEAIRWCIENAPFAEYVCNGATPPLPYAAGTFDFVYGISVLTHLDQTMERLWLAEIRRITRPGAVVMLTIHGPDKAARDLRPKEYASYLEAGFRYKTASGDASVVGLPNFYQVAYHTPAYIAANWSRYFDIQGYVRHGCMYAQDCVLMRVRDDGAGMSGRQQTAPMPAEIVLPIAVLDSPTTGSAVEPKKALAVGGWAFIPEGPPQIRLKVRIDGEVVGECQTGGPRPDVAAALGAGEEAKSSGFSLEGVVAPAEPGPHVIWICLDSSDLPLCVTYFEVRDR